MWSFIHGALEVGMCHERAWSSSCCHALESLHVSPAILQSLGTTHVDNLPCEFCFRPATPAGSELTEGERVRETSL